MVCGTVCHPYIESATALSDYYNDEEIARISGFCWASEMDFQCLAGPTNVSVDLKYDVCAFECLCMVYTRLSREN